MTRFEIVPERSTVWIDGTSSLHPIRATATGLQGWFDLATTTRGLAATPFVAGEVRIPVESLQSGNPLVDRETRRRIDAKHHPEIVGTVTESRRTETGSARVGGVIAFRGVEHAVEGPLTVHFDHPEVRIRGEQDFDVRWWQLEPPRVAMLRVHPDIHVRVEIVASAR
ncbi:MAG: YceI family protein [Microthrixaceae bacterium]